MRKSALRGSILVVVLLLSAIFLTMASAFMHSQALKYRGASLDRYKVQAQALAEAGLEDARLKLEKDPRFPPLVSSDQTAFGYTEQLDLPAGKAGAYQVLIDCSRRYTEHKIILVRSTGLVGPIQEALASSTLEVELDVSPTLRTSGASNPNYFQIIHWEQNR